MANNFRLSGDFYISKAGHDSNDGLSPDTPKKTPATIGSGDYIVGAGYYTDWVASDARNYDIYGDGKVYVQGVTHGSIIASGRNISYFNCELDLSDPYNKSSHEDSRFINHKATTEGNSFSRCVISNSEMIGSEGYGSSLVFTIILGSIVSVNDSVKNSYCDIATELVVNTNIDPDKFSNNNIQGIIDLEGIKYAIKDQFSGTPQDNGYDSDVYWLNESNLTDNGYSGTISGWDDAAATCINRDPKFNDSSKLDFTLKADSPHLGRASDGTSNIGGTNYAQSFYAGISNPNMLLLEAESGKFDTDSNPNDWVLEELVTQGWIRAIMRVADSAEEISVINYIGNLAFDSDEPGGTTSEGGTNRNFNVPDSRPITSEYPDYLQTTGDAPDDTTLLISSHGASVGEYVKVQGQYREITAVPDSDTIEVETAFREVVDSGVDVQVGTFEELAALNPNRLNMKMRTTVESDVNSDNWDNDGIWDNNDLVTAGTYLVQEWGQKPKIDSLNGVGIGDDEYDDAYGNTIQATYIDLIMYLRDNYKS